MALRLVVQQARVMVEIPPLDSEPNRLTARSRLTKALTVAGLIAAAVALAIAVVNYDFEH